MNVALSELPPDFTCLPARTRGEHQPAAPFSRPRSAIWRKAFRCPHLRVVKDSDCGSILIPSPWEDSLSPPGKHVASRSVNRSSSAPHGESGTSSGNSGDLMIDTVNE